DGSGPPAASRPPRRPTGTRGAVPCRGPDRRRRGHGGPLTAPLPGLVVVIPGAARGSGRAAAERFLAGGARVVALDRSWDGAQAAAAAMDGTGRALRATAGITDPGAV